LLSPQPTQQVITSSKTPATNAPSWTLDLASALIPNTPAVGKIHGRRFTCDKATLQGGALSLIHGAESVPDCSLTVFLFSQKPEHLAGKALEVSAERAGRRPRVLIAWRTGHQPPVTETIETGYTLRIAFEDIEDGKMPGQIFLGAPDGKRSFVA